MRSDLIRSLTKALGGDKIILEEEQLAKYKKDALDVTRALPPNFKQALPLSIVRPETELDVISVIRFARKNKIALVPYGAGTGLMGGAVPVKPSIVVDMRNMNRIEIIDDDLLASSEPGAVVAELSKQAKEHGFLFAHDPWSAHYSTVGGAISTNGVGYLACKYGSMGEQVLGLRAVTGNGSLINIRPARKRSTGLDLGNMFIGSEGMLGIITSAVLKLHPYPEKRNIHAFEFEDLSLGYRCVKEMFAHGLRPASLDLFEAFNVNADPDTRKWLQDEEGTMLYMVFDGFSEEVEVLSEKSRQMVKKFEGTELDEEVGKEYWTNRYDLANRYISFIRNEMRNTNIKFDFIQVSIPSSKVLEYDAICRRIASRYKLLVQGHGIWQAPELYSMNLFAPTAKANGRMYKAIDEMLKKAIEYGTMEYVHGVGLRLAHLMAETHAHGLAYMRKIKRIFDPNNIMNPRKLSL